MIKEIYFFEHIEYILTISFSCVGVYNKNRNFRLYLSNKLGKDNPLVCAESGHVGESMNCNGLSEEDIFMKSLITNVEWVFLTKAK